MAEIIIKNFGHDAQVRLRKELKRAITNSYDPESIRENLLKKFQLGKESCSLYEIQLLLFESLQTDHKTTIDVIIKFAKYAKLAEIYSYENLEIAIERGNLRVVEFLLELLSNFKGPLWNDQIFRVIFSSKKNRNEILKMFLERGLSNIITTDEGLNMLHLFIQDCVTEENEGDEMEIVKTLINYGTSVDQDDNDNGWTPLIQAVLKKNTQLILLLIERGADVNKQCEPFLEFPLLAASHDEKLISLLLTHGANINAKSLNGFTTLHIACVENANTISHIIQRGAQISAESKDGKTPFSLLNPESQNNDQGLIAMIKEFSKLPFENLRLKMQN